MKRSILLFIGVFISLSISAQEISPKQHKTIRKFKEYTINHNEKGIFKLLEKNYRGEQLDFLKGNRKQLIDELYSGPDLSDNSYVNSHLDAIIKIEVAEVEQINNETWEYVFRIRDESHDFFMNIQLVKVKNKYKFVGAVG